MFLSLLIVITGIILLYAGSELVVRGGLALSRRFHIPPVLAGVIFMGLGTSSPELVVSIKAALIQSGEVAVGNIVGSNISNLALVLGIAALIWPVSVEKKILTKEVPIVVAVSVVFMAIAANGWISPVNGILLLLGLAAYIWLIYRNHDSAAVFGDPAVNFESTNPKEKMTTLFVRSFGIILGLFILIYGSILTVNGSLELAHLFQLSDAVVGLTIVAIGTSLPELATAISASIRKEGSFLLGGLIGSNILNVLFVLGVTALLGSIQLTDITLIDLALMTIIAALIWPICRSDYQVSRLEGATLLVIYIGYLGYLFSG